MTSLSTALPRPPTLNVHPGLHRAHSRTGSQMLKSQSKEEKRVEDLDEIEFVDERPVKRRKTSSGSLSIAFGVEQAPLRTAPARCQSVPWTKIVRANATSQIERSTEAGLPPLPKRPWPTTPSKEHLLQDARPPSRVRKNVAVPNTPDCIETPSDAPLFEQKTHADYFPWTGKHLEDVLSEGNVVKGYFERPPQPLDKELHTAKAPLYHAFKHRSGLDSLSALFSLVLESKSKHGAFSSTSSFKGPPPRVTLTEVKRKSWISDLANTEVPLRRLSKTIPQGIRGTLLLEQCLSNSIPLSRAIWFTKCVGANEIRTLKRKGVNPVVSQGAEIKWLREWTTNVEQFIESVLAQCGQSQWKEKVRYSLVFAARLYSENLLDRDHYLDWILKSLSAAASNHWPFWLMVVHLHRIDLIAFRKRGKQLAECLVLKYNAARAAPGEALQPLALNFAAAIRPLVTTRPNCFLMPDRWSECQKALESCLDQTNDVDRQNLKYLKLVNERAAGNVGSNSTATASSSDRIVELLDSFQVGVSVPGLYDALLQACPEQESLAQKCLEWCVSKFRAGSARVYLSARLFRKLRKQGCDVDSILLGFIFNKAQAGAMNTPALKHLISELSRSQTFPMSKYMQWLSVRGLPRPASVSDHSFSVSLGSEVRPVVFQQSVEVSQHLEEVCLLRSEDHLVSLRNSLLSRAGFDTDTESTAFDSLRSLITTMLAALSSGNPPSALPYDHFSSIPWAIKTRLSYWLRSEVAMLAKASQTETPGKPPLPGLRSLTLARFCVVREVLEKFGDTAILADVLRITATSRQEDILAAAVDTINTQSLTLSAIGALEPLQLIYGQVYVALRSVKTAMPLYATALIDLCQQYPVKLVPVKALQHDFVRGDRGRAVTACSPFSDGVAESLQQAGVTFHDDFEAILQTESNMSDQTMIRLFKVLIERIDKTQQSEDAVQETFVLCQLLARLKLCQKSLGEGLVRKWITRLYGGPHAVMSPVLLFSLICTRCVQLEAVLDVCQQLPVGANARSQLYTHIRHSILAELEENVDESLAYGFRLAVSKLVRTKSIEILDIIGSDESGRASTTPLKATLIATAISNPDLIKALSKPAWLVVSQVLSEYFNNINSSDPPEIQAKALALAADSLALPYCSLRMRMLCQNAAAKTDERIQDDIATVLCATAADPTTSLASSPQTFQSLLRATGPVIGAKIRSHVEQAFFNALPKFLQSKGLTQPPLPTQEETDRATDALQQVVLVSADMAGLPQPSGVSGLIEKLTIYMKLLGPSLSTLQTQPASSPVVANAPSSLSEGQLFTFLINTLDHLNLLLQLLCIKRTVFTLPPSPPVAPVAKTLQQDQIKLIGLLITIGTHPVWLSVLRSGDATQRTKIRETINFSFDVAATLADDMSDESRTFCARILKDKIKDERVRWLLGSVNSFGSVQSHDTGAGYQITHEAKGVLTDWKPKTWELLESAGSNDSCLGLGLFGARKA